MWIDAKSKNRITKFCHFKSNQFLFLVADGYKQNTEFITNLCMKYEGKIIVWLNIEIHLI